MHVAILADLPCACSTRCTAELWLVWREDSLPVLLAFLGNSAASLAAATSEELACSGTTALHVLWRPLCDRCCLCIHMCTRVRPPRVHHRSPAQVARPDSPFCLHAACVFYRYGLSLQRFNADMAGAVPAAFVVIDSFSGMLRPQLMFVHGADCLHWQQTCGAACHESGS